MSAIEGKVFRSGDGVAVRLPDVFGFLPGASVTIERTADGIIVGTAGKAADDPDWARRNNQTLADEIAAIWAEAGGPPPPEKRDPDIFPDRPGLY